MRSFSRLLSLGVLLSSLGAAAAHATTWDVNVYTGDVGGDFNAVLGSVSLFTAANNSQQAAFTYTGALNFSNGAPSNTTSSGDLNSAFFGASAANISNYHSIHIVGGADYGSFGKLANFMAASGSIASAAYGSLYVFTERTTSTAGEVLTITHDDGVGLYVDGALVPGTTTGPTVALTETVVLPAGSSLQLVYTREHGTPSVLQVGVPEPVSMSLLGVGVLGLGIARRRRAANRAARLG